MNEGYRVLDADELSSLHDAERDFAYDVLIGLSEKPKRLPARYFYDDAGSVLFSRIMDLEEYYLTDCEQQILEGHKGDITDLVRDRPFNVVDLGAGDGKKTMILLEHMVAQGVDFRYVPIDISEGAMRDLVARVHERAPSVIVDGIVSEYTDGLHWLAKNRADRSNLVLFLGSNIGNFDKPRARAFLRRLWSALREGDRVLIGFDLKKDIDTFLHAYNDAQGITAAFNLNLLTRINRELGGRFNVDRFRHFGTYDVFSGAMKSYLVSLDQQAVEIEALRHTFHFEPWEPVHTEYSYKYLRSDIEGLARDTGFIIEAEHLDPKSWFVDSIWRVGKSARVG